MADSLQYHVGQQIGNYRLLHLLRQERAADVYQGEHIFLNTQATITVLHGPVAQETLNIFLAEARRVARLKHPNLLRILESGVEGKTPFLVTDYLPDGPLALHELAAPLPADIILAYIRQLASALQYIHDQGLVYRGLRPENIVRGPQQRVLLNNVAPILDTLDAAPTHQAQDHAAQGSADIYLAPDQLQGHPGPASDQYALGILVHTWISRDTALYVSPELAAVVSRALAADPQQRFDSVTAFAQALEHVLVPQLQPGPDESTRDAQKQHTVTGPVPGDARLPARSRQRSRNKAASIGIVLLVVILFAGVYGYSTGIIPFSRATLATMSKAQQTQVAITRGTAQAVATFTARSPQAIYTAATSGKPLLDDPLTRQSTSAWPTLQVPTAGCLFTGGLYHLKIAKSTFYLACLAQNSHLNVHNFAFEVELSTVSGNYGGLIFRSDPNAANFYAFIIPQQQAAPSFYNFVRYENQQIVGQKSSSVAIAQKQFHLLSVVVYENTFYFYLDRTFVMQAQDNTLQTGEVGLYASATNSSAADMAFSHARFWKL